MTTEYEYRLDRKTGYRTAMHLVVFAALAVVLLYVYRTAAISSHGSYR